MAFCEKWVNVRGTEFKLNMSASDSVSDLLKTCQKPEICGAMQLPLWELKLKSIDGTLLSVRMLMHEIPKDLILELPCQLKEQKEQQNERLQLQGELNRIAFASMETAAKLYLLGVSYYHQDQYSAAFSSAFVASTLSEFKNLYALYNSYRNLDIVKSSKALHSTVTQMFSRKPKMVSIAETLMKEQKLKTH